MSVTCYLLFTICYSLSDICYLKLATSCKNLFPFTPVVRLALVFFWTIYCVNVITSLWWEMCFLTGFPCYILKMIVIPGAHLNPAVSVSLAVVKKFPLSSLCHYLLAQYLGAFLGSALVLLTYRDALHHYSGGRYVVSGENSTAGIFTTFPAEGVTNIGGAIDQVGTDCVMLLCYTVIY